MRAKKPNNPKASPDYKYNSLEVSKLINRVMQEGKKSVAERHVYKAFDLIEKETKQKGFDVFLLALGNIKPKTAIPQRSEITKGLRVLIVLKQDQGTGRLTEGFVQDILTECKAAGIEAPSRPAEPEPSVEMEMPVGKLRRERNWARLISLALFIILIVAIAAIHVVPLDVAPYEKAAQERFGEPVRSLDRIEELLAGCDLLLVIGTSAGVYPAAGLPGLVKGQG
ncbi:MAG: 30S ribosomal protein S7, partial [Microgenomates group bacterium GW2011_GWF2_47_9]